MYNFLQNFLWFLYVLRYYFLSQHYRYTEWNQYVVFHAQRYRSIVELSKKVTIAKDIVFLWKILWNIVSVNCSWGYIATDGKYIIRVERKPSPLLNAQIKYSGFKQMQQSIFQEQPTCNIVKFHRQWFDYLNIKGGFSLGEMYGDFAAKFIWHAVCAFLFVYTLAGEIFLFKIVKMVSRRKKIATTVRPIKMQIPVNLCFITKYISIW